MKTGWFTKVKDLQIETRMVVFQLFSVLHSALHFERNFLNANESVASENNWLRWKTIWQAASKNDFEMVCILLLRKSFGNEMVLKLWK